MAEAPLSSCTSAAFRTATQTRLWATRSSKMAGVVSAQVSSPTATGKLNMASLEQVQSQHGRR
eukprot:15453445-Alexandrium_andersonii.AAC.1